MGLDWIFKLTDLVSGPTAAMDRQLHTLTSTIKALDLASRSARIGPLADGTKYQTALLRNQRDQLLLNKHSMEQHGGVLSSLADKITTNRQAMRDWLLILDPLARGFRYVADSARDMGRKIAEAVTTREEAMIGLRSAFGDRGGRTVMNQMQAMASRTGRPFGQLADQATRFGNLGMDPKLIGPAVSAISDAQARKLDAGRLEQTLTAMLSRPVLDMREIKGGLTGVMDEKKFWNQLAKNMGVTVGDANLAVGMNRAPARQGVDALLQAFAGTQGGRLGTVTNDRANSTLQGILDRFTERTSKLLGGIENTAGFKTLKSALNNLLSVMGEGKTQKMINDLANNLGSMLKPLTGPDGKKRMRDFFDGMKEGVDAALPGLQAIVKAVGFLAKWGVVKPVQGIGMLADVASDASNLAGGKGPSTKTGASFFGALYGDMPPPVPLKLPSAGQGDVRLSDRGMSTRDERLARMDRGITVNVKVDARGATKDDANEIARAVADQTATSVADSIEQISNELGAQ